MSSRTVRSGGAEVWSEIHDLFVRVLNLSYVAGNRQKAALLALHLLRLVQKQDPQCKSLLAMSTRWLVADLDGDIEDAVRYREEELATLRAHLAKGLLKTGAFTADQFSDRLDMLAADYLTLGRYADALRTLDESEAFCREHGIPFDGGAIRKSVKRAMTRKKRASRAAS